MKVSNALLTTLTDPQLPDFGRTLFQNRHHSFAMPPHLKQSTNQNQAILVRQGGK